ncbi:MAG: hypothetical protein HDQ44_01175 [Desulfovibrio sp.]|nr:hypothetical protein [Desulfovibrio sp.]
MANDEEKVDQEIVKEDPAQTIAPPYLKLQQEPIPNPDIKNENKGK